MLVESEGNIRMTMTLPPVHIAIAGIEKVVPSRTDFGHVSRTAAASGTGQPLTSYVSILHPPLKAPPFVAPGKEPAKPREFHLVLIDNGRSRMREDPVLHEALYCIRCSACLNSCANFETVGGHAFGGETYSGGIGGSWEAGTGTLMNARFSELCTACSRCVPQLPGAHRYSVAQRESAAAHESGATGSSAVKSAFGAMTGSAPEDSRCAAAEAVLRQLSTPSASGARRFAVAGQRVHAPAGRAQPDGEASSASIAGATLPPFPKKTWEQLYREETRRKARHHRNPAW